MQDVSNRGTGYVETLQCLPTFSVNVICSKKYIKPLFIKIITCLSPEGKWKLFEVLKSFAGRQWFKSQDVPKAMSWSVFFLRVDAQNVCGELDCWLKKLKGWASPKWVLTW